VQVGLVMINGWPIAHHVFDGSLRAIRQPLRWCSKMGVGEQRNGYGTRSITVLMESATLWKVDATEAALRAERGLDRFP
jgi:hypothetical protein